MRRWRAVARLHGLILRRYFVENGFSHYWLETRRKKVGEPSFYLSAGIHGDEAGATEGAIAWAEENGSLLEQANWTIFPCLNPFGLTNNLRVNAEGRDLNRECHNPEVPMIRAWQSLLTGRRYDLAMCLHEDYDAQGFYIYELAERPLSLSMELLAAARRFLPADVRRKIDDRPFRARGFMQRHFLDPSLPDGPESIYLGKNHASVCLTLETPSEFDLDRRIRTQVQLIRKSCDWIRRNS